MSEKFDREAMLGDLERNIEDEITKEQVSGEVEKILEQGFEEGKAMEHITDALAEMEKQTGGQALNIPEADRDIMLQFAENYLRHVEEFSQHKRAGLELFAQDIINAYSEKDNHDDELAA